MKIISKVFDPHQAAEIVTLENSLGVRHVLTIHIGEHETCPGCGRLYQGKRPGTPDVEGAIAAAVKEFAAHEKKLLAHQRKRKK
jgi:hypothetical protein